MFEDIFYNDVEVDWGMCLNPDVDEYINVGIVRKINWNNLLLNEFLFFKLLVYW